MDSITLSKDTIKAIRDYAANYEPDEPYDFHDQYDVEFHQDGCDILVDMDIYGYWKYWTEKHGEVPPPNEEYFSEWVYESFKVDGIVAYDQEGEEVTITNVEEI